MQKQAENQVMYMGSLVIKDAFDVAKPRLVAEVLLHTQVNRRTVAVLLKDVKTFDVLSLRFLCAFQNFQRICHGHH